MKKLKQKQLGPWCSYCRDEAERKTSRAVYVSSGWREFACEYHKDDLVVEERHKNEREERITEADNQTWGRL